MCHSPEWMAYIYVQVPVKDHSKKNTLVTVPILGEQHLPQRACILNSVGVSHRILNMTRLLDEFEIANLFLVEGSDDQLFFVCNARR